MTISSSLELQTLSVQLMGGIADDLNTASPSPIVTAVEQTLRELNWSLPMTDSAKEYWIIERTKRHILMILVYQSAKKFKFNQFNLNQKFDHYWKMIDKLDKEFLDALDANPELFDVATSSVLTFYITNGFSYDFMGRDWSYTTETWLEEVS